MAQGYFPTFTPKVMDLTDIYKNFNPAASFLGGMKAVRDMQLDQAAEERLREAAEMDRLVKSTMLPYEVEMAKAKLKSIDADTQRSLAYARYLGAEKGREAEQLSLADQQAQILAGLDGIEGGGLLDVFEKAGTPNLGGARLFQEKQEPESSWLGDPSSGDSSGIFLNRNFAEPDEEGDTLFDNLPEAPMRFATTNMPIGQTQSDVPTQTGKMVMDALESQKSGAESESPSKIRLGLEGPVFDGEMEDAPGAKAFASLPDTPTPKPTLGAMVDIYNTRRRRAEEINSAFRNNSKDIGLFALNAVTTRQTLNDAQDMDAVLRQRGMTLPEVRKLVDDFGGRTDIVDQVVQIKQFGVPEANFPAGQPVQVIGEFLKKQQSMIGAPDRSLAEAAEIATKFATIARDLPEGAERNAALQNVAIYTARAVPPEERPRMLMQKQARYAPMFQNWTNGNVNFEGVEITKDMAPEQKITAAEEFRRNAGIDYPVIRGTIAPDGTLDTDDDEIARAAQWYRQFDADIPDTSLVAVAVKTDRGEAVFPFSLNLDRQNPEKSELNAFVDFKVGTGGNERDAKPDAGSSSVRYSDLGLKGRELLGKSVIAAGLNFGNVGPAMTNVASGLYEAGEAFVTGKKSTPLPRYRLYDGSDVDRIYKKFTGTPFEDLPEPPAKKSLSANAPGDPEGKIQWPERP